MDSSNHFPFPHVPGIPYLWTSSNNFPPRLDSQPFLLSLTDSPSKESSSFRPMTLLLQYNWPVSSYSMSSRSTEYPAAGHVTSDRGSEFISHFFCSLSTALGMKLHFTSGYHPEGDGQTEWVNQTLE